LDIGFWLIKLKKVMYTFKLFKANESRELICLVDIDNFDSFKAEMEGLSIKKGKAKPPRLTHLESSITRHKAHIMKLELILRLLDNDELSPELVNDVKDFIDDYVERNQVFICFANTFSHLECDL
ncbi:CCR4-NOT complex, subunit 3/ 5, partial [Tanacetum coccineum]